MSVIAYIETQDNKVRKQSLEAATYAVDTANKLGTDALAVIAGPAEDVSILSEYGISKAYHVDDARFNNYNDIALTKAIQAGVEESKADVIVGALTTNGGAAIPQLAIRLDAGMVSGALDIPDTSDGTFILKKNVFSGKAFAYVQVKSEKKVIGIHPGSYSTKTNPKECSIEPLAVNLQDSDFGIETISQDKITGTVPLNEAELVVSGGRGLKGPENWSIIEDLADALGASLACSRPVADSGWRPHHEHVGQTGGTIRPQLYIAVGISGAIQHLAGVNSSKNIVVINIDPEAPFFKAADYGVVGDAFEVLPKLTEAVKKYKAQ